jgi:hypothetical protein
MTYVAQEVPPGQLGSFFKKLVSNTIKFTQAVDPVSKVLSKTKIANSTVGKILVPTAINLKPPAQPAPVQQAAVEQPVVTPPPTTAPETSGGLDPTTKKVLIYGGGALGLALIVYLVTRKKKSSGVAGVNSPRKTKKKKPSKK